MEHRSSSAVGLIDKLLAKGDKIRVIQYDAFVDRETRQEGSLGSAPLGWSPMRTKVLMLNRSYLPIHVTSVRRAFTLLYLGIARVVNEKYQNQLNPCHEGFVVPFINFKFFEKSIH